MTQPSNHDIVCSHACLLSRRYGVDPAHWPVRRSQGGGDGLLEMVPLVRYWHRLLDDYDPFTRRIIALPAVVFWYQMWYNHGRTHYLGPEARIEEVLAECKKLGLSTSGPPTETS
jgi:hypothetical protein